MAKSSKFMIAHGASVVVVRDGVRKTISAGSGDDFTEDEIATVKAAVPGALRVPVNEGRGKAKPDVDDDDDDTDAEAAKAAKAKDKAAKAKTAKAAKSEDDDEDI